MPNILLEEDPNTFEQPDVQATINPLLLGLEAPDITPSIKNALDRSPDKEAENRRLSQETGIPQSMLSEDNEDLKKQQRTNVILESLGDAPATTFFLSSPECKLRIKVGMSMGNGRAGEKGKRR